MAGDLLDDVSNASNVLHASARRHDSKRERDIGSSHPTRYDRLERWQIIRMNDVSNSLHRHLGPEIKLEDPVRFVGPVVILAYEVGDEAARFAQTLGVREAVIGA